MSSADSFSELCKIALSPAVVRRAARVAVVVGLVLAALNHGGVIMQGNVDPATALKIMLTFCVPYSVSTYSSVLAVRELTRSQRGGQVNS
ncbi:nitrate/nitrite transporter NrtS [Oceaniovalibus sp. ACAM 378]|uniref:nitrate/nitrite transporter NrtS n=1 Tax=Oceaniovalibus sp. ACAM 378 TaxID=2599923 RepID=UPI0011DA5DEF|nr:hypothetical protein FQ320_19785 [Oceaniovalibus sp. ACAM 378]